MIGERLLSKGRKGQASETVPPWGPGGLPCGLRSAAPHVHSPGSGPPAFARCAMSSAFRPCQTPLMQTLYLLTLNAIYVPVTSASPTRRSRGLCYPQEPPISYPATGPQVPFIQHIYGLCFWHQATHLDHTWPTVLGHILLGTAHSLPRPDALPATMAPPPPLYVGASLAPVNWL